MKIANTSGTAVAGGNYNANTTGNTLMVGSAQGGVSTQGNKAPGSNVKRTPSNESSNMAGGGSKSSISGDHHWHH